MLSVLPAPLGLSARHTHHRRLIAVLPCRGLQIFADTGSKRTTIIKHELLRMFFLCTVCATTAHRGLMVASCATSRPPDGPAHGNEDWDHAR